MKYHVNSKRVIGKRSPMLYGHFIEHFHRQIYDGIYDPGNELSDEEGFRKDIIEAMKKIKVPLFRHGLQSFYGSVLIETILICVNRA